MELQPDGLDAAHGQRSRRALIAVMVILGLMLFWGYFFAPEPVPRPAPPPVELPVAPTTATSVYSRPGTTMAPGTATQPSTAASPSVMPHKPGPPRPPLRVVRKVSKLLAAEFTSEDAALRQLILLDHYRTEGDRRQAQEKLKRDPGTDVSGHAFLLLGEPGCIASLVVIDSFEPRTHGHHAESSRGAPDESLFASRRFRLVSETEREVVFRARFADGKLELTKTFRMPSPTDELQRHIELEIQLRNLGSGPLVVPGYALRGAGGISLDQGPQILKGVESPEAARKASGQYMYAAVGLETKPGDLQITHRRLAKLSRSDLSEDAGLIRWVAVESSYFAALLEPVREEGERNWVRSGAARPLDDVNICTYVQTSRVELGPGEVVKHRYRLFVGAKTTANLEHYGYTGLRKIQVLGPLRRLNVRIMRWAMLVAAAFAIVIVLRRISRSSHS
ncbi:hypothetical protein ACFL09_01420 [Planctomycetota bacterium]